MPLDNPYLRPPGIEGPKSRSWGLGFAYGFQGPAASSMARSDIQPEDADAFDEGVLAGQGGAINGLDVANPCIDLNAEGPTAGHLALTGVPEGIMLGAEVVGKHLAGGILSGVLLLFELSIALETFTDDPRASLNRGAVELQQDLVNMGFSDPLELFVGGGVDISATGCELKITGVHRFLDSATTAVKALNRAEWLVASWRTDQSGGARIVASSQE